MIMKVNKEMHKKLQEANKQDLVLTEMKEENIILKAKVEHLNNKLSQAVKYLEICKENDKRRD